jgi:hypothetical protein
MADFPLAPGPDIIQRKPLDFSGLDDFSKMIADYRKNQITNSAIQQLMGSQGDPTQRQSAIMQLMQVNPTLGAMLYKQEPTALEKAQTALDEARIQQIEHPQPKWGKVSTDWSGNPVYGYPPQYGGETTTPPQATGGPTGTSDVSGLTGEEFLKASGLPPEVQERVRSIARGDQPPPSGWGKIGQSTMAAVSQYDPTYKGTRWQTQEAFGPKGRFAVAVQAIQTLPGHMRRLWNNNENLGGVESWFGPYAKAKNAAELYMARGGSSDKGKTISALGEDLTAVPEELERVWRGTGGNVTEIEAWKRNFDMTASPTARRQAISELAGLVLTRVQTLKNQYAVGMGINQDKVPENIIPKALEDVLWDMTQGKNPQAEPTRTTMPGEGDVPKSPKDDSAAIDRLRKARNGTTAGNGKYIKMNDVWWTNENGSPGRRVDLY